MGCTLTPSYFDGEDLLNAGHKTEMQDPVAVPIKEFSDKPHIKTSTIPVAPPIMEKVEKPVEAPPVKMPEKIPEKAPEIASEKPVEKKTDKAISETKLEPVKKAEPIPVKPETCKDVKKGEVAPPPPPGKQASKTDEKKREVLRSSDRLKIVVFREKDLTGEYQINDKGMISFPLVGPIMAAGLTPHQLQENLMKALSKGYLVKPEVNVEWLDDCNPK